MVDNLIFAKPSRDQNGNAKPIDPNAMPAFWVGEERPSAIHETDYVLKQVGIALDVNGEDRKMSADRPLQEIPLLALMYHGGDIVFRTDWAPGLSRYKGFTRDQVETYINWVRNEYVVVTEKTPRFLFDEVYRTPKQFVQAMKTLRAEWNSLIERKKPEIMPQLEAVAAEEFSKGMGNRISPDVRPWEIEIAFNKSLNPKDIAAIVALVTPRKDLMDELELGKIAEDALDPRRAIIRKTATPNAPKINAFDGMGKKDDEQNEVTKRPLNNRLAIDVDELDLGEAETLQDHLVADGFDRDLALDVSSLAHDHPAGVPHDVLKAIPSLKSKAARDRILSSITKFSKKPKAATVT